MDIINAAIRAAGVEWHECEACGRDWPFPKGFDPQMTRWFICAVCFYAEWSALRRQMNQPEPAIDGQHR